ncbi:MAG: hypothetical protein AB198_01970 [Parcubacteria bacterium C7867-003]|nr:MAG: hypothetical protein AB198_01970 [Parcubacteria bacterium C7867-003]
MNFILSYIATLIPLAILDSIWLLGIGKGFYAKHMSFLFGKINLIPAVVFYPVYALGILLLAIWPAVTASSWTEALWRGALLGLVSYGAYDLTNQATIPNWPTIMTLVDMAWGMVVTALTSVIAYFIITNFW